MFFKVGFWGDSNVIWSAVERKGGSGGFADIREFDVFIYDFELWYFFLGNIQFTAGYRRNVFFKFDYFLIINEVGKEFSLVV